MREDDYAILSYVHPLLAATVIVAAPRWKSVTGLQLRVTEGYRNKARQKYLFETGKSRTLDSAHQEGLAVDLAILTADRKGAIWEISRYEELAGFMRLAFIGLRGEADLISGGTWSSHDDLSKMQQLGQRKPFIDGVHWELRGIPSALPLGFIA